MKVGKDCYRYCGTPLACSVSEAGQQKGIVLAELGEKGTEVKISVLPLEPLRRIRVIRGSLKEVLDQGCGDYVSVVLTDRVDLDVIDMQDRMRHAFPICWRSGGRRSESGIQGRNGCGGRSERSLRSLLFLF